MKALASLSHHWIRRPAPIIMVLTLLALPLLVYVVYADAHANGVAVDTGTRASALASAQASPATLSDRIELASSVTGGKASELGDASGSNLATVVTATESVTITSSINPPNPNLQGWYQNATVIWSWSGIMAARAATSSAPCDPMPIPDQKNTPVYCLGVASPPISRDGTPPKPPKVTAKNADGTPYAEGTWATQNVTVSFEPQGDNGDPAIASGGVTCYPPSQDITKDQYYQVNTDCSDAAGNFSHGSIVVKRDTTAPKTNVTIDGTPSDPPPNDWYMLATVKWQWDDTAIGSGIDNNRCTKETTVDRTYGDGQVRVPKVGSTVTCYDLLGHMGTAVPITVKKDLTSPYYDSPTTATSKGVTYNLGDWTNKPVTVSFTCKDQYSGPVGAAPGVTTTKVYSVTNKEGENQTVYALKSQCVDKVGWESNGASYGSPLKGVSIDMTDPVITHALTPPPNNYLWNNTPVTVTFTCAETGTVQSGIVTNSVAGTVVSTEGKEQPVTNSGSCVDKATNAAAPDTVKVSIDWTKPKITPLQPPGSYLIGCGTTPEFDVVDSLSGLVRPYTVTGPVPTVSDDGMLVDRYTVTAEDKAGNVATEDFDYLVYKTDDPFWLSPINANGTSLFNLGNTIPIKFELYDCNNQPVTDADARLKVVWLGPTPPGSPTPAVPTPDTKVGGGDSGNKFRRTGEYYQFNWSTKGFWVGNYSLSVMIGGVPLRTVKIGLR